VKRKAQGDKDQAWKPNLSYNPFAQNGFTGYFDGV